MNQSSTTSLLSPTLALEHGDDPADAPASAPATGEEASRPGINEVVAIADIEDIIPHFLGNRWQGLMTIEALVSSGALPEVVRFGHQLKGLGGLYGFEFISAVGTRIEAAARAGDIEAVTAATAALRAYLDSLVVVFSDGTRMKATTCAP